MGYYHSGGGQFNQEAKATWREGDHAEWLFWWGLEFSSQSDKGMMHSQKYTPAHSFHLKFAAF